MRYATASAFRAALEQRFATTAQQTGIPLVRLRKLVVFDRLMARLLLIAPNRWVLKGAVALQLRLGPQFRTTKDLDLGRQDNEEAATADFVAAQSVDLGDYFTFTIERTGQLDPATEGATVRYHATAQLAGRRFEDITVDVGFGGPTVTAAELLHGPDLLGFADIPPIVVPVLPLEQHVAEKLHAYTRMYAGGIASTRAKDLIDLVAMSSLFAFQAGRLRLALEATFAARGTHPLPPSLPPPPSEWRIAYRRMATEAELDATMEMGWDTSRRRHFLVRRWRGRSLTTRCGTQRNAPGSQQQSSSSLRRLYARGRTFPEPGPLGLIRQSAGSMAELNLPLLCPPHVTETDPKLLCLKSLCR